MSYLSVLKSLFKKFFCPALNSRSLEKNYDISENTNYLICAECGGACCKSCGCHFSPDDFEDLSFYGLKKEIEKGYISIDCVNGKMICQNKDFLILRIRNQGSTIVDTGFRTKKPCILLTNQGCKLDYEHRPTGGKLLVPNATSSFTHQMACHSKYNLVNCCYEWEPHQKVLKRLVKYFTKKDFPCSL